MAEHHYREALALAREVGTQEGVATFLGNLGTVVLRRGDPVEALRLHRECLALRQALGHQHGIAVCLEFFGAVAIVGGRYAHAARCYGAAERLRELIGAPRDSDPADAAEHQHYFALARAHVTPEAWTMAWAEGRTLDLEQALAEAVTAGGPASA